MSASPLSPSTHSSRPDDAPRLSPTRKWSILLVLSLALAVIILDTTILNVALSSIIRDLHTDIQSIQWVITGYSLTLAALTITGGRMGDIFGRKRMFVLGAMLFAGGSFLASISTNIGMLIAGESIIEGIGAALMMPATSSLLVTNFAGRERAIAFGVWGGIAGASAALGPILGGYLTTRYDWRWGFRVNLLVVALLILGSVLIPESRDRKEKVELDWFGVLLSAAGMLSLVFGVIESPRYGWWHAKESFVAFGRTFAVPGDLSIVPLCVGLGLVILACFLFWERAHERRGRTPLVSIALFANRTFTSGVITTAIMSLGQTGLIFALPVFLQAVRGLDAYHTGLSLLPMSLSLLIVAPLSAALSKKISPKAFIVAGLLVNVVAYVLLYSALNVDTTTVGLIPGLAAFGIGMGLVMSQINNLTLSAVESHQVGEASGVNNTLRQVGSTLGSTIIGTILVGSLAAHLLSGIAASSKIPEDLKPTIGRALEGQTSAIEFGGGATLNDTAPKVVTEEITRIGHQATVDAARETFAFGAVFAFAGFLVAALLLPGRQKRARKATSATSIPTQALQAENDMVDVVAIGELIALDAARRREGKPGLGSAVRTVLDAAMLGALPLEPRIFWARRWWDAGIGPALGFVSLAEYARSIPEVPAALAAPDAEFPDLLFVEQRLSTRDMCGILGIRIKHHPAQADLASLTMTGSGYWARVHDGRRYAGKSADDAQNGFARPGETACGLHDGLALHLLRPQLASSGFYLDLPAHWHEGFDMNTACLGRWDGSLQIRWRRSDLVHPACAVISKKIAV